MRPPASQVAVYIHVCPDSKELKTSKEFNSIDKMELMNILICMIPVRNRLSSLRDYFCRGAQRTDEASSSPEAQYQQNKWACVGLLWFQYGSCCKEASNCKTCMLHTHLKPSRNDDLYQGAQTFSLAMPNCYFMVGHGKSKHLFKIVWGW